MSEQYPNGKWKCFVPRDDAGSSIIAGVEGSNFFRFFRPFPPPGEEL